MGCFTIPSGSSVRRMKRHIGPSREMAHDLCHMADTRRSADHRVVDPTQLLAACGLVIGTVDYALMVRRRAHQRRLWREAAAAQEAGLHGLVRVLLIDR
jgi:predicted MarR family transcription regulator